jgi:peptidoglycan/xylan/chitin deacetylase (PgdA/CDA1 family)
MIRTPEILHPTVRKTFRDSSVFFLSQFKSIKRTSNWIRFPYFHRVLEGQRADFARMLGYLQEFGDFLPLDAVVDLLMSGAPIHGRHFCITFDDGFRCCYDHALPILAEKGVPAAFFVATDFVADEAAGEPRVCRPLHVGMTQCEEYLTWEECQRMMQAGMALGSHTCSHARLAELESGEVRRQLSESKNRIEEKTGRPCRHFACPFGIPGRDFVADRDPALARDMGFDSFLTNRRGPTRQGNSPWDLRRDHIRVEWGNYQLRYFLSQ